jgi:dienelactone hydrolase
VTQAASLFPAPATDPPVVERPGVEERDGLRIADVELAIADDRPIEAYLVEPASGGRDRGAAPGVLFGHWFDTEAPNGNRTEFLAEALGLAARGASCLLPQLTFPWTRDPAGSQHDREQVVREVGRLRHAMAALRARPGVDARRIAFVGHDFGAMHLVLAAAAETDVAALVVMAGTPRWADWYLPFWPIEEDRLDYLREMRAVDPVEHLGGLERTRILLQFARSDFFIAAMTGLELKKATGGRAELKAYEGDHEMSGPDVRADRLRFLEDALGLS